MLCGGIADNFEFWAAAMNFIADNVRRLENRIAAACAEYGRQRDEITLVAVSKNVAIDLMVMAYDEGIRNFGENRVQEATSKISEMNLRCGGEKPIWHMIGHLQKNKVRKAVQLFDTIDSVDSISLAEAIDKEALAAGRRVPILLEVNSSGEDSKYGFDPAELIAAARTIMSMENLELKGLMTVGPLTDDSGRIDAAFELTLNLFLELKGIFGDKLRTISMGMSDDLERAIKYGTTEIRVGTAIFGSRG